MRIQKFKKTKKAKNLKQKSQKTLGDGMVKNLNGSCKLTFKHFSGAKKIHERIHFIIILERSITLYPPCLTKLPKFR